MRLRPKVSFAKASDGTRIAYAIHGDGPPLVFVRGLNSHVEDWWADGWTSSYFQALAQTFSVILYDARGNGLSDPSEDITLERCLDDLVAVVEDAGLSDVTLYGQGFGSPIAIAYAAGGSAPVSRLILYCAYAQGTDVVITDEFIHTMRTMPHAAAAFMARESYPDEEDLPTRLMRPLYTPAEIAARYFELARAVDVHAALADVGVPTLVMQPERNPVIPFHAGRQIAEAVANASLVSIPGGSYNPFSRRATEPSLHAIGEFLGDELIGVGNARPVVLMLTDMVDSTAMTQRAGEAISRTLHELQDAIVQRAIAQNAGELVKHTGDGLMVSFGSAGEALSTAVAVQAEISEHNRSLEEALHVRIGIAAGEAYVHSGQPFATAAQLVTRVTSHGGPDQILATEAVREQASSQGFAFGPSRSVTLKGFSERMRLHEVVWARG